ncbi:MAG: hypothetical protein AB7F89_26770 [Pirellulaceae bacterium]
MKLVRITQNLCAAVATVGLLLPHTMAVGSEIRGAAPAQTAAPRIVDVSLAEGGVLQGQVLNVSGTAQAGSEVKILRGQEVVARTTTDQQGAFSVSGIKGGVYLVSTAGSTGVVRAWAPRTAPPSAVQGILLVPDNEAVRAQLGNGGFINQYGGAAIILGGLIATVVWVAVEHNDDAS